MEREQLKTLRPLIATSNSDGTKPIELFQNEVLRPIIKFQHDIIISIVKANDQFIDLIRTKGPRLDFHQRISVFIGKQQELKYRLIGIVVGLLTLDELAVYIEDQREFDKRIHQMICQRLTDTLY